MHVFLGFIVPGAVASCHAAMCFSGHVRSFMHPHIREYTRRRLVDGLECETVDVFFYLALEETHETGARKAWDYFTRPPVISPQEVCNAALEFNPIVTVLHRDGAAFLQNDCGEDSRPDIVLPQLYKTAACFGLIESAEHTRTSMGQRPYDWIVRVRPDLAWVGTIAPLYSFRKDRVYLPGHFWPVGDMFAIVPRHLARSYFRAIDSFYDCTSSWVPPPHLTNVRANIETRHCTQLHFLRRSVPRSVSCTNIYRHGVCQSRFTMASLLQS